jgi:UDP-N-acetylmuramoyl-L-alanyl-D-glutamate--2,6-diaminopimelate ligase
LDFQSPPVISYTHNMKTNLIPQQIKNYKHYFVAMHFCRKYGNPSKKLKVIGVTGSDGKTTTANILYHLLKFAGLKVGVISTISVKTATKEFPLDFHVTNPAPKDLQKILRMMLDEGIEIVVLETTSHGLDQYRVAGIQYDFAVYTNVTHEHLDYHKTYEKYLQTKGKLIKYTQKEGTVILNHDDQSFPYLFDLATMLERKIVTYGFSKNANIQADEFVREEDNMVFSLKLADRVEEFSTNLKGRYNISNIMACIGTAIELGVSVGDIRKALLNLPQLDGRWEVIQQRPFNVIIDFAHTPNALENILHRADQMKKKDKNLIVVFGCAGKRDKTKRAKMGSIAGKYGNKIILTAEDPRGENVEKINEQIIDGIKQAQNIPQKNFLSIPDREQAILQAITLAKPGDIILIAGKGHERSMNLDGKTELPWSDKETTLKLLKVKNAK